MPKFIGGVTQICAVEFSIVSDIQKALFDYTKLIISALLVSYFSDVNVFWPFPSSISHQFSSIFYELRDVYV